MLPRRAQHSAPTPPINPDLPPHAGVPHPGCCPGALPPPLLSPHPCHRFTAPIKPAAGEFGSPPPIPFTPSPIPSPPPRSAVASERLASPAHTATECRSGGPP
ncbi:hypothetical protein E2562_013052 [Oryza meyeriana var. granulata]|uniref:Uncharacterized protein n=1 Tax=Oryza meyeriana var. granulata TaxID=110450 RepID=A0A6G1DIU7_9ORYZ|nr:hypothetical protein E2562_013052 [Oryza meyeriana var. granulata]